MKKAKFSFLFLAAVIGCASALAQDEPEARTPTQTPQEIVSIGKDVVVREGEVTREVVVIGADAIVNGSVRELVVIGGSATINGTVRHDLVVVGGGATLGSNAVVRGESVVIGGDIEALSGARFERARMEFAFSRFVPWFHPIKRWFHQGLLWGRPLPHQVAWAWCVALIFLAIYAALALLCPRSVERCAGVVESRPIAAFMTGLLSLLLFLPLLLLLAVSVVGTILVPFLFCAAVVGLFFGKAAILALAGRRGLSQFDSTWIAAPATAVLVGGVIVMLVYLVPVLGFIVWGVITTMALGAAVMAMFRRRKPSPLPPVNATIPPAPPSGTNPLNSLAPEPTPVTPEPAPMAPPPAAYSVTPRVGFWMRLCATALDALLFAALAFIFPYRPLIPLLWLAYHVCLWRWRGTTIGGMILGLQIVRVDGGPWTSRLRLFARSAVCFPQRCCSSDSSG
jgi:hypothetical protein